MGGEHRAGTREHRAPGSPPCPRPRSAAGGRGKKEEEEEKSRLGVGRSEISAGPGHTAGGGRGPVASFPVPSRTPLTAHGAGVRTRLRTGHVRMFWIQVCIQMVFRLLCRAQRSFRGKNCTYIYIYMEITSLHMDIHV